MKLLISFHNSLNKIPFLRHMLIQDKLEINAL